MTPDETLTPIDVVQLADVLNGVFAHARVRRALDNEAPSADIVSGTLRYLCGPDLGPRPDDVRDCHVRVTLDSGFEACWPLVDLARDHARGAFAIDYPERISA